ncbi:MAG TPA: DUF2272 domain-containing protein [Pseudomonadaceae bacterium]|nr:DUF2272 domain-containing protein [Pseudomonadaceae bacterium]
MILPSGYNRAPGALACLLGLLLGGVSQAQDAGYQSILETPQLPRLDPAVLPVTPPAQRISGEPGSFRIVERECRNVAANLVRERIVHTAVQEWAFFGFQADDLRNTVSAEPDPRPGQRPRWRLGLYPEEVAQVAADVAGYWAAIPGSDWILNRQNEAWQQTDGLASRWRDPWSAAFISWVMCESGLDETREFQRAIAHHSYIDQAIRARDTNDGNAAYYAYEPGEAELQAGDMLCSGLRPMYRSLAERRSQLGEGARTHCDIVVKVDSNAGTILTIGGNVRASVRMKIYAAGIDAGQAYLAPLPARRPVFAHLKLRGAGPATDLLQYSPTLQQMACTMPEAPRTFELSGLQLATNDQC